MAIKKGAFELYATKRQLPNKSNELLQRKSHFFDNVIGNENSTKLMNEQLIIASSDTSPFDSQGTKSELLNGSQKVHERFTERSTLVASDINIVDNHRVPAEPINGSQKVHTHHIGDDNQLKENSYLEERQIDSIHSIISFSRLIGNQRNVVIAFYKNIQMNDYVTTKELTLDEIAVSAGVNKKSLKNTLFRLASAGFITRADQKVGRGGWVKYQLNQDLKNEIDNISIYSGAKKK